MKALYKIVLLIFSLTVASCNFSSSSSDDSRSNGGVASKYVRAVRDTGTTTYGTNSFIDNNDDTVTDENTGLMWTKYDSGHYLDNDEGIDYNSGADGTLGLSWGDALTYAESSEIAGYSDWRLPNVKELQSIVDYDYAPDAEDEEYEGAALDPEFFVATQITNESGDDEDYPYYWTGTSALFKSGGIYYYAWYVAAGKAVNGGGSDYHGAGAVRFDVKNPDSDVVGEDAERYYNYVRLVRDYSTATSYPLTATGQTDIYDEDGTVLDRDSSTAECYGQDGDYLKGSTMDYTDNGDGTITDNVTGLMWQQDPSSTKRSWSEAIKYCDDLELADYSDWRAPTLKELFSISDFSTGWPYINQDYFDLIDNSDISKTEQYWSSNDYAGYTVEGHYDAAFGVNHATGHIKAYSSGD